MSAPDLTIDVDTLKVVWRGRHLRPTRTELLILCELAARPGHLKSRDRLLDVIGDYGARGDRCIDTHIKRIRRKFRAIEPGFDRIEVVYGMGYRWREADDDRADACTGRANKRRVMEPAE